MVVKLMRKISRLVRGEKKESWAVKQIKGMAKLGGRLILM